MNENEIKAHYIENEPAAGESQVEEEKIEEEHPDHKPGWGRRIFLLIFLIFVSFLLTFVYSMAAEFLRKDTEGTRQVDITINQGDTATQIAQNLKRNGVIRYTTPFLVKTYLSDYRGKMQYGTFTVHDGMSLDTLIKKLSTEGEQKGYTAFTIPEGDTIARIAARLEKKDIMKADDFLLAVKKQAKYFAYEDQLPSEEKVFYQLEGYIYPDTYYVTDATTGDQLVEKILANFEDHFDETRQNQARKMGLSVEEVLIRASMVQKETGLVEEYPMVADVIQNRLDRDMNLQFDSTVVYALTKGMYGKERVLHADLKVDSPYNTYLHKGLPVGPICSPSIDAIDGVLNPDDNDYLFFQYDAVKDDGSNLYFETYEEHDAAAATTGADGKLATQTQPAETEPAGGGTGEADTAASEAGTNTGTNAGTDTGTDTGTPKTTTESTKE